MIGGYKRDNHSRIEAHRGEVGTPLIALNDPTIKAIASDSNASANGRPTFDLNDTGAIADFISSELDL